MKKQIRETVAGIIVIALAIFGIMLLYTSLQSDLHDTINLVGSLLDIVKDHRAKLDSLESIIISLEWRVDQLYTYHTSDTGMVDYTWESIAPTNTLCIGDKYEIEYSPKGDSIKINGELYKENPDEYQVKNYELYVTVGQNADYSIPDKTIKVNIAIAEELFAETVYDMVNYELEQNERYYNLTCFYIKKIECIIVKEERVTVYPIKDNE